MGSQSSGSSSRPATGAERLDAYNVGAKSRLYGSERGWYEGAGLVDSMPTGGYTAPEYERLGEGDYETVRSGLNASTERQQNLALRDSDQNASDRGIFTSLNALRLNNDVRERFAPQFAANDAKVVEMKAQDLAGANAAAMENANRLYESKWRPADYKAGLWNGTGGVISSGSSGGWSI